MSRLDLFSDLQAEEAEDSEIGDSDDSEIPVVARRFPMASSADDHMFCYDEEKAWLSFQFRNHLIANDWYVQDEQFYWFPCIDDKAQQAVAWFVFWLCLRFPAFGEWLAEQCPVTAGEYRAMQRADYQAFLAGGK